MSEHDEQCSVITWFDIQYKQYKERLFAVPNAAKRSPQLANYLKAEGLRKGVLDLWLPIKRGEYSGLVIEMKFRKNKLTPEQKEWIAFLITQGFKCCVCYSFEEAKKAITDYLNLPMASLS